MKIRKTRVFDVTKIKDIVFVQSIGTPYSKIYFDSGEEVIVCYSHKYLLKLLGENLFQRVNKGILVNKTKIINQTNYVTVNTGHEFMYSRRQKLKIENEKEHCITTIEPNGDFMFCTRG